MWTPALISIVYQQNKHWQFYPFALYVQMDVCWKQKPVLGKSGILHNICHSKLEPSALKQMLGMLWTVTMITIPKRTTKLHNSPCRSPLYCFLYNFSPLKITIIENDKLDELEKWKCGMKISKLCRKQSNIINHTMRLLYYKPREFYYRSRYRGRLWLIDY